MAWGLLLNAGRLYQRAGHYLKATIRSRIARPIRIVCAVALWVGGAGRLAYAATAAPFAAPEQVAASSSTGGLVRVVVALLVVLGAVIAAGRFARRVRGFSGATGSALEVLGQLPLSTRERAVLIRVGDRQLLIGVAPGNVRTLHVFDDAPISRGVADTSTAAPEEGAPERPSFKSALLKSLGK
jgi:flagellar protein FliO/FliZ